MPTSLNKSHHPHEPTHHLGYDASRRTGVGAGGCIFFLASSGTSSLDRIYVFFRSSYYVAPRPDPVRPAGGTSVKRPRWFMFLDI
jgi:hypothetical protein